MAISHFVKVELDEGHSVESETRLNDDVFAKLEQIILKNDNKDNIE